MAYSCHGLHDRVRDRQPGTQVLQSRAAQLLILRDVAVDLDDVGHVGLPGGAQRLRKLGQLRGHRVEGIGDLCDRVTVPILVPARVMGRSGGRQQIRMVQHAQSRTGGSGLSDEGQPGHDCSTSARARNTSAVEVAPGSWCPMLRAPK